MPTISARVVWLAFSRAESGLNCGPKPTRSNRILASRFSLGLRTWSTYSSSSRPMRKSRYETKTCAKAGC